MMSTKRQTRRPVRLIGFAALVTSVAALAWPAAPPDVADAPTGARQFVWGRDSVWSALESSFTTSRTGGCTNERAARAAEDSIGATLEGLRTERTSATAPSLDSLEEAFFRLAPQVAVCGALANDYVTLQGRLREAIKWQSAAWDLTAREVRDRLYQSLYGSRAAVEEVMLQHPDSVRTLFVGSHVPSATPSAESTAWCYTRGTSSCHAAATRLRRSSPAAMIIRGTS